MTEDAIRDAALRWHLASTGDAMDWDGFTAWLEADPRHSAAYDEIALTDMLVAEHAAELAPVVATVSNDNTASKPHRRWAPWAGGAIAATLVGLLAIPMLGEPDPVRYEAQTTGRAIALDDGSTIDLAPHSSLEISGSDQDHIALSGGAWFDIRHDPSRAMVISAGGVEIKDIGTQFDVQTGAGVVRVEVAQGEVRVGSAALVQPVRLTAGHGLRYDAAAGRAEVRTVAAGDLGEWRDGRLTFSSAPLSLVVDDLSRYAGLKIELAEGLQDRRFSGTLVLDDGDAALRDLAQVMGLAVVRDGVGYRLSAGPR
jgi:transmembrane sensor